jgi:hypothetical protein
MAVAKGFGGANWSWVGVAQADLGQRNLRLGRRSGLCSEKFMAVGSSILFALGLGGCGGGDESQVPLAINLAPIQVLQPASPALTPSPAATPTSAADWEFGPIINGLNYSVGMPTKLLGLSFDFPQPDQSVGHVHYVTFRHGSLAGKSRITLRYRIDAAEGVRILPKDYPLQTSTLTLYFQRRDDNWSAQGSYQYYRWYASGQTIRPLAPGEYTCSFR